MWICYGDGNAGWNLTKISFPWVGRPRDCSSVSKQRGIFISGSLLGFLAHCSSRLNASKSLKLRQGVGVLWQNKSWGVEIPSAYPCLLKLAEAGLTVVVWLRGWSKYQSLLNVDLWSTGIVHGVLTCPELLDSPRSYWWWQPKHSEQHLLLCANTLWDRCWVPGTALNPSLVCSDFPAWPRHQELLWSDWSWAPDVCPSMAGHPCYPNTCLC